MLKQVYIVGKMPTESTSWELQGVFTSFELAWSYAQNFDGWFLAPVNLNERLPLETKMFPSILFTRKE